MIGMVNSVEKLSINCTGTELHELIQSARNKSELFGRAYVMADNEHIWVRTNVAIKEREVAFGAIIGAVFVHGRLAE